MDALKLATGRQERIAWKFQRLVKLLKPAVVCDIGSLNGADALRFKSASPTSQVFAFEANPFNFERAVATTNFAAHAIFFDLLAIADHDGMAQFHLIKYDRVPGRYDWRMGASSLRRKLGHLTEPVAIPCRKLDTVLLERGMLDVGKALWIDAEGAADVVLAGSIRSLETTLFLKVEVEKTAQWEGQGLDTHILLRLDDAGFEPVDTSSTDGVDQYDILMVRREILEFLGRSGTIVANQD